MYIDEHLNEKTTMLTKKQAWLRVAEMATRDKTKAPWYGYTGLCDHIDDLTLARKISDTMSDNMVSEMRIVMDKQHSHTYFWGSDRREDHQSYNATHNEDRILGALFMAYSGLTSEDIALLSK